MIAAITAGIADISDREFMTRAFERYAGLMLKTARQYLHNSVDAEDAVQDSVIKMIQNIEKLRSLPENKLAGYIVTVVKHTAFDRLRAKSREAGYTVFFGEDGFDIPDGGVAVDKQLESFELRWQLGLVWKRLSERERFLLEGKYILDYSDAELAEHLDCKKDSIRMMLKRARAHAFDELRKEGAYRG